MANPFAGLNLPSPQQIQQAQMAERQQAWASGNPYAMQQATLSNFLDTMFGNPQQMQAERLQKALSAADQSVVPADGDTDIDTQLKRARAMRDAVADLDPSVAAQLNTQMLQLGQVKLEQDKLKAEERRANAEEARNAALFPVTLAGKIGDVTNQANEVNNWMDPKTGAMASVLKSDAIQNAAMRQRGYVLAGKPTLQGSKDDITGLTKPVITDLQTSIADSQKQLDAFGSIMQKWNPSFLTLPTQAMQWANSGFEKLTGESLSPAAAAQAQQFYEFRTQTTQALNSYIKSITGAQAAVAEYDRLEKSFPNMKQSPSEFLAALRESVKNTMGISKRANEALATGLQMTPEMVEACRTPGKTCIWSKMPTPPVSDEEVDAFLSTWGVPARSTSKPEAASAASPDSWMQMPNGAKVRVKK